MKRDRTKRSASLGLSVLKPIKLALDQAARDARRSTSAHAEMIVVEWLKANRPDLLAGSGPLLRDPNVARATAAARLNPAEAVS